MLRTSGLKIKNAEAKTALMDVRNDLRNVQVHPQNWTLILALTAQFALRKDAHAVGSVTTA